MLSCRPVQEKFAALSNYILQSGSGLAFAVALFTVSPIHAQTPDECWNPVELPTDALVELIPIGEQSAAALVYQSSTEASLQSLDRRPLTTAGEGEIVRLMVNDGKVTIQSGPLLMIYKGVYYHVPDAIEVPLMAQAGTRLKLHTPVAEGKLPAEAPATVIVDSQESLRAKLTAPLRLSPTSPKDETAWVNAGALPITRGGRMLLVDLHASRNAPELRAETFQACIGGEKALVVLTAARDGVATLSLLVPEQVLSGSGFYSSVSFQVLGITNSILSAPVTLRVGNPYWAALFSLLITLVLMLGFSFAIERRRGPKIRDSWSLLRLFVGQDGEPSLSLFQMYIWTGLVVAGMIYVFLMSGDLLNISEQVLVLLGLAGLSSISSRFVGAHTAGTTPSTGHGFWGMFLVGGKPDLLRLQMFIFTVAIWLYVAVQLYYEQSFPELDANVLLLMGISNGVYVGAKWAAGGDSLAELRKLHVDREVLEEGTRLAEGKQKAAKDAIAKLPAAAERTDADKAIAEAEEAKLAKATEDLYKLNPELQAAREKYSAELNRLSQLPAAG